MLRIVILSAPNLCFSGEKLTIRGLDYKEIKEEIYVFIGYAVSQWGISRVAEAEIASKNYMIGENCVSFFTVSSVCIIVTSVLMALALFLTHQGRKFNIIWGCFCLLVTFWGVGSYQFSVSRLK